MRTLERLLWGQSLCSTALLVWLTLFGVGAGATTVPAMQEARPVVGYTMGGGSMPMASDCMPCARCFIAPAPATQGGSGEFKESEPPTWWVHTRQTPATVWHADSGSKRCSVPIRITFCRWLD